MVAAAGGDHGAFGELYDRYAPRIHDLCLHLLHNRDDAADATAEVFLSAAEHIGQLRDPAKCKSWLYAITRNEAYRRTRRRSREQVIEMDDDMVTTIDDDHEPLDGDRVTRLLREAALGLDPRDQLVLELTLAGGLEGRDLAESLGVSENGAHQATHRMRERLGRSVGALMVARQGRADCAELARLLEPWDGSFSVLWRKRVARHVDGCDVCERRRKALPAALFSGTAFAAAPIAFVAPPADLRADVLGRARLGRASGWGADGFPPAPGRARRRALTAGMAALVVLLAVAAAIGLTASPRRHGTHLAAAGSSPTTTPIPVGPASSATSDSIYTSTTTPAALVTPTTAASPSPTVRATTNTQVTAAPRATRHHRSHPHRGGATRAHGRAEARPGRMPRQPARGRDDVRSERRDLGDHALRPRLERGAGGRRVPPPGERHDVERGVGATFDRVVRPHDHVDRRVRQHHVGHGVGRRLGGLSPLTRARVVPWIRDRRRWPRWPASS